MMKKVNHISTEDTKRYVVAQSNELIEANYSSELTAQAHKIVRLIISLIKPDDEDLRTYTVSVDDIKKYLGIPSNTRWGSFYDRLKETAQRMNRFPIEIQKPDGKLLIAFFISSYELDQNRGTITFEISSLLKPYLLGLKEKYTSYQLAYIPNLKSSYSIRLYELLQQYRKIGKRYFLLSDLQKKVGSNYNDKYNNFKRRVLEQAQTDLKKYTDIVFVFSEVKDGRKVIGINFYIFGNRPEEQVESILFLEDIESYNTDKVSPKLSEKIVQSLNELGINEQSLAKYLAQEFEIIKDLKQREIAIKRCDQSLETYYLEKIQLTLKSKSSDNPAGFLVKALQEDWMDTKKDVSEIEDQTKKKKEEKLRKINLELSNKELNINEISEQRDLLKQKLFEEISRDIKVLTAAYDAAKKTFNDFMLSNIQSIEHLPIEEQYNNNLTIKSAIHSQFMMMFPDKFSKVNELQAQILTLNQHFDRLKKESDKLTLMIRNNK